MYRQFILVYAKIFAVSEVIIFSNEPRSEKQNNAVKRKSFFFLVYVNSLNIISIGNLLKPPKYYITLYITSQHIRENMKQKT